MNPFSLSGIRPAGPLHFDLNFSRSSIFACAGVLAAINAQASDIIVVIEKAPVSQSVAALGGVSAVIWFAMYAALKTGFEAPAEPVQRRDIAVLASVVLLALLPVYLAAPCALLLSSIYLMATSRRDGAARGVAFVLLALTAPLIWGRILLSVVAWPFLRLDAHLVGLVIGAPVDGNIVHFANSSRRFLIAAGCSSVHNMSLALVLWTTAAVLFKVRIDGRYVAYGLAMVALMFALNIARLSAIGLFPESFDLLHVGAGAAMFSWAGLLGAGSLAAIGVAHASARQQ